MTPVADRIAYLRDKTWQVEPEWCESVEDGFAHWPFRLRQEVTHVELEDGFVRWAATTDMIRNVADIEAAIGLCNELNKMTAGWAYVVDPQSASVRACTTFVGSLDWDQPYTRWVVAATVSFWHADVVADRFATKVGGLVDVTYPSAAPGPRPVPDGMFKLVQSERARPEWVFDPGFATLPEMGTLDEEVRSRIGADFVNSSSTETLLRIAGRDPDLVMESVVAGMDPMFAPPSSAYELTGQLDFREPFGQGFLARARMATTYEGPSSPAAIANRLNRILADDGGASLAGSYVATDHNLWYEIFVPGFALRSMTAARSHPDGVELLANVVSGLASGLASAASAGTAGPNVLDEVVLSDEVAWIISAFNQPAVDAFTGIPNPYPDRADRRFLWTSGQVELCTFGFFNPIGPTLTTLQLGDAIEGDTKVVTCLMRHPFAPQFKELGQVTQLEELRDLLQPGAEGEFGSMPEFVDLGACPTELREQVSSALFDALSEHAGAVDVDLGRSAASYAHYGGRAWDRLNHTEVVPAPPRVERPADEFLAWWSAVTNDDHVIGTLFAFPSAWDGAIDFQREQGNLGLFDME